MEFVDVHTHILPEVDDGARNFDEALLMLAEAKEAGVKKIFFTPHVFANEEKSGLLDKIASQFNTLQVRAADTAAGIDLYLGAELMIHPDLPQAVTKEKRLTLNGTGKTVLFEMPMSGIPLYSFDVCFSLLTHGFKLVWAHPERCSDVIRDYRIVKSYVDNGVSIQIDAGSLTGLHGRRIRLTAETLVKKGLVHMLASDAHRRGELIRLLPEAFLRVKRLVGDQKAADMCVSAPSAVLSS